MVPKTAAAGAHRKTGEHRLLLAAILGGAVVGWVVTLAAAGCGITLLVLQLAR
jgi:uncharacterized membrane protein YsdA (DUF1294 family)